MKITKILTIFTITFLLGCLTVFTCFSIQHQREKAKAEVELNDLMNLVNTNTDLNAEKARDFTSAEETETVYEEPEQPDCKIDMLLTGEFHGDEVDAKTGEKWLGLFFENGKSRLVWTKLKVRNVRDFMDDEKSKERTGKSVTVSDQTAPIFLLKHADSLSSGDVKTSFYSEKEDETERYQEQSVTSNSYRRDFKIDGKIYTLKMTNDGAATDSDISKGKLVLVSGDSEQIISDNFRNGTEFIDLLWAGDLDRDGKLDLYINLSRENVTGYTLFLSSQAKKGKLVEAVAVYGTVGC